MTANKLSPTESRNAASHELDSLSSLEFVDLMNSQDAQVIEAIHNARIHIAALIEVAKEKLKNDGRIIYIGAGTSGRLGVLDASECPPTFSSDKHQVIGIIAGGDNALRNPIEGAEDNGNQGAADLKAINLNDNDVVIGIAASGNTPYVIGALDYAKEIGAKTASISNNPHGMITTISEISIVLNTGAEVLTGSTRLKAGTAQKIALNMVSTGAMVGIGKAYENLMVDVAPSNEKLRRRAERIVKEATHEDDDVIKETLNACEYKPKIAILMLLKNLKVTDAITALDENDGHLKKALKS